MYLLSSAHAHIYCCIFVLSMYISVCWFIIVIYQGASRKYPKTYLEGIHPFCGYLQISNLDWECPEFGTYCRCFIEFSLEVSAKTILVGFHIVFFLTFETCNCLLHCMSLFVNVHHVCSLLKKVPTNRNPVLSFHLQVLPNHSLHWVGMSTTLTTVVTWRFWCVSNIIFVLMRDLAQCGAYFTSKGGGNLHNPSYVATHVHKLHINVWGKPAFIYKS